MVEDTLLRETMPDVIALLEMVKSHNPDTNYEILDSFDDSIYKSKSDLIKEHGIIAVRFHLLKC